MQNNDMNKNYDCGSDIDNQIKIMHFSDFVKDTTPVKDLTEDDFGLPCGKEEL